MEIQDLRTDNGKSNHRVRTEASALGGLRDLYSYGEASYAQRLPFSQRERLAPREKQLARHGGIRV
ncbi:hypothetical protein [Nostoc sp.]|uniref:hypothetical protein n=1 Tax=Nostoc sp. TaxID=1180 RepID=UPI002FFB77D4